MAIKKKKMIFATLFVMIIKVVTFSDSKSINIGDSKSQVQKGKDSVLLSLTVEELSQYNGRNGKPSYVAIDSLIYDVTTVKPWKKGNHKGIHSAGTVLTEDIKKSPHGRSVLKKLKVVGKIVEKKKE